MVNNCAKTFDMNKKQPKTHHFWRFVHSSSHLNDECMTDGLACTHILLQHVADDFDSLGVAHYALILVTSINGESVNSTKISSSMKTSATFKWHDFSERYQTCEQATYIQREQD